MSDKTGHALAELGAERAMTKMVRVDPEWIDRAREAWHTFAASGKGFTADDVWDNVGHPKYGDPRALGSIAKEFVRRKKGLAIERVGYRKSRHARRHNGIVSVWKGVFRA